MVACLQSSLCDEHSCPQNSLQHIKYKLKVPFGFCLQSLCEVGACSILQLSREEPLSWA